MAWHLLDEIAGNSALALPPYSSPFNHFVILSSPPCYLFIFIFNFIFIGLIFFYCYYCCCHLVLLWLLWLLLLFFYCNQKCLAIHTLYKYVILIYCKFLVFIELASIVLKHVNLCFWWCAFTAGAWVIVIDCYQDIMSQP